MGGQWQVISGLSHAFPFLQVFSAFCVACNTYHVTGPTNASKVWVWLLAFLTGNRSSTLGMVSPCLPQRPQA